MPSDRAPTTCRICGSAEVDEFGIVRFQPEVPWAVMDCGACGCRFTRHEPAAYETLHKQTTSPYIRYRQIGADCKWLFDRGDAAGLKSYLSQTSKYRFVIDSLHDLAPRSRLLEIGCASGFLTSYFVASGHDILGCDVSASAIAAAQRDFGDHFALADSPAVASRAPYDAIFHVGTIGCVPDPLAMARGLLELLRPGGVLLFNSPNRNALRSPRQAWFETAFPPDLVTIFPAGFWRRQFRDREDLLVVEGEEFLAPAQTLGQRARRWLGGGIDEESWHYQPDRYLTRLAVRMFDRAVAASDRWLSLASLFPPLRSEFGQFVRIYRL